MKKGDIFGLVILLVMIGLMACFFIFAPESNNVQNQARVDGSVIENITVHNEHTVTLTVTAMTASFVTLHETISTAPGPIIAVSPRINAGEHIDIDLGVASGLQKGSSYIVLMVKDDGDGVYEPGIDLPIVSGDSVVKELFTL